MKNPCPNHLAWKITLVVVEEEFEEIVEAVAVVVGNEESCQTPNLFLDL